MQLKLRIGGKDKTFSPSFVSARMLRRTLEIKEQLQHQIDKDGLDSVAEFMVDLFGNQFTIDDFYDGLPLEEFLPVAIGCMDDVIAKFTGAVEGSEKN